MNKIEELTRKAINYESKLKPIRDKIKKIEDKRKKDEMEAKYLGKYFKFDNSYGSGDRWFVHYKVLSIGTYRIKTLSVEESPCETKIELTDASANLMQTEITEKEFMEQYNKLMKKITAPTQRG